MLLDGLERAAYAIAFACCWACAACIPSEPHAPCFNNNSLHVSFHRGCISIYSHPGPQGQHEWAGNPTYVHLVQPGIQLPVLRRSGL